MTLEEYEEDGHKAYARLASTVSTILAASIATEPTLRLQQLQARGKDPGSLGAKLIDRGLGNPPDLPAVVKDLAGCRAIFYTNTDVRAFERSGIIQANFEVDWDRTKLHHPLSPGGSALHLDQLGRSAEGRPHLFARICRSRGAVV